MEKNQRCQVFANLKIDYNFKTVFGPDNKDNMIHLLQAVLPSLDIADITYLDTEQNGLLDERQQSRFDLCCQSNDGSKFIVEIQNARQSYFNYRSVLYSSFIIQRQAREEKERQYQRHKDNCQKPRWNYYFLPVYTIGILERGFDNADDKLLSHYRLREISSGKDLSVDVNYVFLQLDRFSKQADQVDTILEKFTYCLKNMEKVDEVPQAMKSDPIIEKLFESAKFNGNKYNLIFDGDMTTENDWLNEMDQTRERALKQGRQEGIEQGRQEGIEQGRQEGIKQGREEGIEQGREEGVAAKSREIVINGYREGISIEVLSKISGLSITEINSILEKL